MKAYSALILFTLLLSSCITEESPLPQTESEIPEVVEIPDQPFGIHTTSQLYTYLPRLGASWTFIGLLWKDVEPEQDVWNFQKADNIIQEARNNNITLIVKIRTGTCWATKEKSPSETSSPPERLEDYSQFVSTVVSRYKNDVQYWAIENEMNTQRFWTGTLEEYNQVLETAYTTIKEVDPNVQVLDSGFASMTYGICITRDLYEHGEVEEAITFFNEYYKRREIAISSEAELQEAVYSEDAQRTYTMMMDHFENLYYDVYQLHYYEEYRLLDDVIHFIKDHLKKERQIFAVEMGYAYRDDTTYEEQTHAEDMVKLMVSLRAEAISVQIYLPLIDLDADGAEQWRGLVSPERERRPALTSYMVTARLLKDKEFIKKGESDIVWYEFQDVSVLWSEHVTTVDIPEKVMVVDIEGERTVAGHSLEVGPRPLFLVKLQSANYEIAQNIEIAENVESVEFPSYDGAVVRGFLVDPQEDNTVYPAVVLVHGGRSSQQAALQMAETIGKLCVDHGYVALSVDYRDGPLGLQDVEDTLAAIAFLKTLDFVDAERVGVYGGSHGGYIALMCAWRSDVKAVVEAAGFCDLKEMAERILQPGDEKSQWMEQMVEFYGGYPDEVPDAYMEYSPCGHIAEFTAPVFIIHGKMDTTVPVEHAYTLQELLDYHNKPYEIYLSEEGAHGFYHTRTAEAAKVWELIFDFFDKYLKS
ncbi:MAG: prolyl oligopeptidase family serine peptidase [Theionarchaea archaeon]|nr:MAG: hypothetical protein AYK18_09300 [Theionarchaea archaeon DG-70]MBU7009677.1 prolyl oligopeptidase family serine peptidase [Theionarchaea archaeon]